MCWKELVVLDGGRQIYLYVGIIPLSVVKGQRKPILPSEFKN